MCIAILNSSNVTFPKSLVKNSWDNNSQGGGMIWVDTENNVLYTFKEVTSFEIFYNKYTEVRRDFPKSNIVLHFRISTSGGINYNNTHPFIVNKNLAFVHNGIISELNGINQFKSDTNLFNELILQKLDKNFLHNDAIISLIKKFIGSSKLIFLNSKNEFVIINEHLGNVDEEYKGCWFSNSTYKAVNYYDKGGVKVYKNPSTKYGGYNWSADDKWSEGSYVQPSLFEKTKREKRLEELEKKSFDSFTEEEWNEYCNLCDDSYDELQSDIK